jgi:hypothetical protein
VEDLSDDALSYIGHRAGSVDSSGAKWLFVGDFDGTIVAARETDTGSTRAFIDLSSSTMKQELIPTGARMGDDRIGYLTYSGNHDKVPHLVTWDGSCWTDQTIGRSNADAMVVEIDAQKQPWVAWISKQDSGAESLYLRSPTGDTQDLLAKIPTDARIDVDTVRLLPGDLDGVTAVPTVAVRFTDGIRIFSRSRESDSGWLSLLLPGSAPAGTDSTDCLPAGLPVPGNFDACSRVPPCSGERSGVGDAFDLARTQSGAVFAAWVTYSGQGTYAPSPLCYGRGEMGPVCYCGYAETSGTGTADLVVARLTDTGPVLTHFRFDMGGAVWLNGNVTMAARGNTLVLAAHLSDQTVATLTYLEIDSSMLR